MKDFAWIYSYIVCCVNITFLSCLGLVIPPEKVHEKLFVGCSTVFKKPKKPAVTRYNKKHEEGDLKKLGTKLVSKESKLRKRLAAKGIDYDFPGFVSIILLLFYFLSELLRCFILFFCVTMLSFFLQASQIPVKKAQSEADVSVCSEVS